MSKVRQEGQLQSGKGCTLSFMVDDTQPTDSIHSRWTEMSYDGKPDSDVPEVPPHWHKNHDEYMKVLEGRVEFTLNGKTILLKADDDALRIPKMHTHGFKFFKGEPGRLKEYTDPAGDFKKLFFEDLLDDGSIGFVSAIRAGYHGDCYWALPGGIKLLDQVVDLSLGAIFTFLYPQKNKRMLAESAVKTEVS